MDVMSGQLVHYLLIAIFDAALLSWLALVWYRRSMRALMAAPANPGEQPGPVPATSRPAAPDSGRPSSPSSPAPLRLAIDEGGTASNAPAGPPLATPRGTPSRTSFTRVSAAYIVGASLYSAVITSLVLGGAAEPYSIPSWIGQWWINAWPIVPTLAAVLALERRAALKVALGYVALGCVLVALVTIGGQVVRGAFSTAPVTNVFWLVVGLLWTSLPALLLILLTGWRRIRAVTPMVLATTLIFAAWAFVFREGMLSALNLDAIRMAVLSLGAHISTDGADRALFMLLSLPAGWVAWKLLQGIAASFERKRFSDVQLVVDCWWIIAAAIEVVSTLWGERGMAAFAGGLAAFAAYRVGVAAVLRLWPIGEARHPPRLLLLRVFGYQARTEALFDRVAQWWRFRGPVHLVAGPDLATRTADPGDVLALIDGRLRDLYVGSVADVPRRIAALDERPDPDGRFRVNEVYCRDDTWRPALQALLDESDGVLMDLRSFTHQNAGCVFELEQIVDRVPSDRVVLVCDRWTDLALVESLLSSAWARAQAEGSARGSGEIVAVRVERQSRPEVAALMRRLLAVAPGGEGV